MSCNRCAELEALLNCYRGVLKEAGIEADETGDGIMWRRPDALACQSCAQVLVAGQAMCDDCRIEDSRDAVDHYIRHQD